MATPLIFDSALVRRRLVRAQSGHVDFLLRHAVDDLVERLSVVQRRFRMIADVGTSAPLLAHGIARLWPDACVMRLAPTRPQLVDLRPTAVVDLEVLPLAAERLDLVVSALALQSANDLPGALVQIRRSLVPDGLFLGALLGGRTLHELRAVLAEAEAELRGGASPRVAPFADVRDLGGLLQRAGFALPVADSESLIVRYDDLFALMADLRAMGAANALVARNRRPDRRALFARAAALYVDRFGDADGRIRATVEIIFLSGWAPHDSQQQPAPRGSGQVSLARALARRD